MTLTKFISTFLNIQMIDNIQIVVMESWETSDYDILDSVDKKKLLQQINDIYGDLFIVGFLFFVDDQLHRTTFHFQLSEKEKLNDQGE